MRVSGRKYYRTGYFCMKRVEQARQELEKGLAALEEAVDLAHTDLEVDGTIQRFEFTYELFWSRSDGFQNCSKCTWKTKGLL